MEPDTSRIAVPTSGIPSSNNNSNNTNINNSNNRNNEKGGKYNNKFQKGKDNGNNSRDKYRGGKKQYNNQNSNVNPPPPVTDNAIDIDLQIAIEMSKVEFEQQQKQSLANSNGSVNSSSGEGTVTNNKTPKKKNVNKIDMTHIIQFQHGLRSSNNIGSNGTSSQSNNQNNTYNNNHHHNNNNSRNYNNNSHRSSSYNNNSNRKPGKKKKERANTYLQANYLFKINPYGNYETVMSNPEAMVNWNKIEQVEYLCTESEFLCPICFETPVAAKITKCGHISCYGCLIRTLSHNGKCPLCLKLVDRDDLKSVVITQAHKYKVGDTIEFKLLKYKEGTTVPLLNSQRVLNEIRFPECGDSNSVFSRFTIIRNIDDIVQRELVELLAAKESSFSEGEFESSKFLALAESEVHDRIESFKKLLQNRESADNVIKVKQQQQQGKAPPSFYTNQYSNNTEIRAALEEYYTSGLDDVSSNDTTGSLDNISSDEDDDETTTTTTTSTTTTTTTSNINIQNNNNNHDTLSTSSSSTPNTPSSPKNELPEVQPTPVKTDTITSYYEQPIDGYFYLYQASDGQQVYLHPLCVKILAKDQMIKKQQQKEKEKENDQPPHQLNDILKSKILEIENLEITKKIKYRNKVFNILADTTEIKFVEVDLSNICCKESFKEFERELKQRRDERNNKKRQEQRIEKKKELEREHDVKRSIEIREIYEQDKERRKLELEAEREEAENRRKNDPLYQQIISQQPNQTSFLDAIKNKTQPQLLDTEAFKYSLNESTSRKGKR